MNTWRRRARLALLIVIVAALQASGAPARATPDEPPAPGLVTLADDPEDKSGGALTVRWQPVAEARVPAEFELVGYQAHVAEDGEDYEPRAVTPPDATEARLGGLHWRREYRARVAALYAPPGAAWHAPGEPPPEEGEARVEALAVLSAPSEPMRPVGLWYDPAKTNVLTGILLFSTIVLLALVYARRPDTYIRPIAGLEAVEDAVGRATEMGKPMLFVAGLSYIGSISTIAAMLILGHLSRRTAAYETPILVPCYDPLVMAAKREIVREAYTEAGRPQTFRPENIFFVTDSQFGYVAAVDGIMLREKPAANFFMGSFAAEALILAETGNLTGAIQIAGTDSDTQIPFFITSCDYTLIGEELYAASAYLSRHPTLLAQLKGQDIGKAILTILVVAGALAATLGAFGLDEIARAFTDLFAT